MASVQGMTFEKTEALRAECVNTGKSFASVSAHVFKTKNMVHVISDHTLTQIMMEMFNKN